MIPDITMRYPDGYDYEDSRECERENYYAQNRKKAEEAKAAGKKIIVTFGENCLFEKCPYYEFLGMRDENDDVEAVICSACQCDKWPKMGY